MVDKAVKKQALQHLATVRDPASLKSTSRLKKHYCKKASLKQVEDGLEYSDTYTKHKSFKRRFPRRKTQTRGINKQWQMDLIDMQQFKKHNGGYTYIMVAIDVFSRPISPKLLKN